jgi:3-oxoacyl-[acyl-carrier-protein] synthase II
VTRKRVVVTGLGAIAPNSIGIESLWKDCLEERCSIQHITRFNAAGYCCRVGGQVDCFDAGNYAKPKILKQTDRSVHLGMAACQLAVQNANLNFAGEDPCEIGLFFSNLLGGMEFAEPELYAQTFLGPERVSAYQAIAWFYAACQGQWSISTGIQGYAKTVVADRAGGLQAIGLGALAIQRGHCSVAFAGGFEAPLVPYAFLIYQSSGALSPHGEPDFSYRPFHRRRSGLVLGEGSGVLILEELSHALNRNAPIYAELTGFGVTNDVAGPWGPSPDGLQAARAMEQALSMAELGPADIDHILADGAATTVGDCTEAAAIRAVFGHGSRAPTVSVPKSMFGHTLGAAGGVDCALACCMLRDQIVLPTHGLDEPDTGLGLNHVTDEALRKPVQSVLCNARTLNGLNAALVLEKFDSGRAA